MLAVLKNTFDTTLKNWQILLLLLLPGIIISFSDFSETVSVALQGIYLIIIQLVLYLFLLRPDVFLNLKYFLFLAFKFSFVMFLFNFISAAYDVSYYIAVTYSDWGLYRKDEPFFFLVLAVIPMCLTLFYILTRLNVMFPMLIMDRKISLKNIFIISNDSYLKWAAVAAAIYFPLLFIEQYYREEPLYNICNAVLTLLVCCFYSCYYNSKKDLLL